uniref:Uncharacterized protein n=1 Tax=Glossina pallidipes TaxID=7398 RepID=A0A1A9ZZG2_GLOPL
MFANSDANKDYIWEVLQGNEVAPLPHNSNIPQIFQGFTTIATTPCENFHKLRFKVDAIKKQRDDRDYRNHRQSRTSCKNRLLSRFTSPGFASTITASENMKKRRELTRQIQRTHCGDDGQWNLLFLQDGKCCDIFPEIFPSLDFEYETSVVTLPPHDNKNEKKEMMPATYYDNCFDDYCDVDNNDGNLNL